MSNYAKESGRIAKFRSPQGANYVVANLDSGVTIKFDTAQPHLYRGNSITALGTWYDHKKYGRQLNCYGYYYNNPDELDDHLRQLNESLKFVFETLDLKINGGKIIQEYGAKAKEIIEKDPYKISRDVDRIGFSIADKIAQKMGVDRYDPRRIENYVEKALKEASDSSGHVFIPYGPFVEKASEELEVDYEFIEDSLESLTKPQTDPFGRMSPPRIVIERPRGDKRIIYPFYLHLAEVKIAKNIQKLLSHPAPKIPFEPEDLNYITDPRTEAKIELSEEQRDAVAMSLINRICCITGGPGVGKTTIVKKIVEIAQRNQLSVSLCSYTGRASRRLAEAANYEGQTIHRTLAFDPVTSKFQANHENPLYIDLIICDETSMVDLWIGHCLLDALSNKTRIVFVGDADQLPPIGPGALFRQLIDSGHVPVMRLTKIFRQAEGSLIISGSRQLLAKERPTFGRDISKDDLFLFTYRKPEDGVATIVDLVMNKIPTKFGVHWRDIQVLAPVYKGPMGIMAINEALQLQLMGCKPGSDVQFSISDRVIMLENNYDLNVMNGDIGYVKANVPQLVVDFDGNCVTFSKEEAKQLMLAYAISIHKSQGSEYPATIVVVDGQWRPGFFCRNMLYTAMTRGKRVVIFVAPAGSKMIDDVIQTDEKKRYSRLLERLGMVEDDEEEPDRTSDAS
jgi:exodeoxyribonuclease V alpha subunit